MARLDGQRFADLATSILDVIRRNRFTGESYGDAFIRLIGLVPNIDPTSIATQAGDTSSRTGAQILANYDDTVSSGQAGGTVVDGLFKSSDPNRQALRVMIAQYIGNLMAFIERWSKLQRGQQARRLQRLVGDVSDPFDPTLVGATPPPSLHSTVVGVNNARLPAMNIEEVVQQINAGLQEIEQSKTDHSIGKLTLQRSLYNLVINQFSMLMSNLPSTNLGEFGGTLTTIARTPIAGIERAQLKLDEQRRAVGVELTRLNEQEALIVTGVTLETGERLSLKNFLQGFLFLSNLEYKCKNCKFYKKGGGISTTGLPRENSTEGAVCTYTFMGKTGKATDDNKSCFEVWGRVNNDFWTASLEVIDKFIKEFLSATVKGV